MRRLVTALTLAALGALVATPALAQSFTLLVVTGDNFALSSSEHEDLAEESAWIADDFGGFYISRWYQLQENLPASTAALVQDCGSNVRCYVDLLFDSPFDYTLVVNAYREQGQLKVTYQMIDTRVGILATTTHGVLMTNADFGALIAPCHDALKVTPAWLGHVPSATPIPGTTTPMPPPVVTPMPGPTFNAPTTERSSLGQLGKIGAYTSAGGAAFLIGGVLLAFAADESQQEIQAEPHPRSELEDLQAQGTRRMRAGNALMSIGGAALAGGITLLIVDRLRDDSPSFSLRTDGQTVWLRSTF